MSRWHMLLGIRHLCCTCSVSLLLSWKNAMERSSKRHASKYSFIFFSIIFCQATFPLPLKVDKIHFPHLHYTIYFLWWITSWFWLVVIVTKNATWETICIIFQHSTFSVHKIQPTKYLSQSGVKTTKLACTGLTPSAFGMSLSFEASLIAQHQCRSSVIFS